MKPAERFMNLRQRGASATVRRRIKALHRPLRRGINRSAVAGGLGDLRMATRKPARAERNRRWNVLLAGDKSLIYDGQPRFDDVNAPPDRGRALVGETLRKSFPLESGSTLPGHVVRLMLMLAHVEPPADSTGEADMRLRSRKRRTLRKVAAISLGFAAAIVRRRRRWARRSSPR